MDRRKARRVNLVSRIEIKKPASLQMIHGTMQWTDDAILKNVSFSGAYFEYSGKHSLKPGDILVIKMRIPVPIRNLNVFDYLTMEGRVVIVHTKRKYPQDTVGIGVMFLEDLSVLDEE